eukprot:scaffold316942_cov36-Tisochrysis_lutea.AAC.1
MKSADVREVRGSKRSVCLRPPGWHGACARQSTGTTVAAGSSRRSRETTSSFWPIVKLQVEYTRLPPSRNKLKPVRSSWYWSSRNDASRSGSRKRRSKDSHPHWLNLARCFTDPSWVHSASTRTLSYSCGLLANVDDSGRSAPPVPLRFVLLLEWQMRVPINMGSESSVLRRRLPFRPGPTPWRAGRPPPVAALGESHSSGSL